MRIAQIAPPWLAVPPKGYGGIEWVVSLLADGLVEHGHDVTLFAPGDSTTLARLESVFPVAPGPEAINSIWHDAVHAAFALRDPSRFDVLHVHPWWSTLVAAVQTPVPVVHTLHTAFFDHVRRIYEQVADRAWFVAISEAQRAQMPELRSAGVVYNGIDLDMYPLRAEKQDYLLFLGRTAPEKGMARAIEAARAAGMRLVCAVKVASETERQEWNDVIAPLLGDDIEVLGEVTHEEKVDLLSGARAVLFPIDWEEPFGLVMTEAMACGTPVIATRRGSVPEVIADGETGFIVSVDGYADEAADRLRHIGEIDPVVCRSRVSERFSKRAMIEGYERVYERVTA
ncbi:MAG: glycosyltransferase family 4 protein [Actinomycetota bacterium]